MPESGYDQGNTEQTLDRVDRGYKDIAASHQRGITGVVNDYHKSVSNALSGKDGLTPDGLAALFSSVDKRVERITNASNTAVGGKRVVDKLSGVGKSAWSTAKGMLGDHGTDLEDAGDRVGYRLNNVKEFLADKRRELATDGMSSFSITPATSSPMICLREQVLD